MRKSRDILFGDATAKLELLRTRVCDLGLRMRASLLDSARRKVYSELEESGIELRPNFYLSNEYGTVPGTVNVGVGFWDADERLRELNYEARGFYNSRIEIVNLLRHESGHAFCYTYKLYRTGEFRRLFKVRGHFFATYPTTDRYVPNPWSKDFVNTVGDHYAQKHPDDDFAETFAEFLQGEASWRRRYRYKPGAIRKLGYVKRMARRWGRKPPLVKNVAENIDEPAGRIRQTVAEFLHAKLLPYRRRAGGYLDSDLLSIFRRRGRANGVISAPRFVRKHRRTIFQNLTEWAEVPAGVARDILDKVESRAEFLDLVIRPGETRKALVEVTSFVTSLATRFAIQGRF